MTDFTVVIPTRDRPGLLPVGLKTVLGQREVDLDVVIVDDASTTPVAAAATGLDDTRVRVLRNEDPLGVSASRNRGAAEASGAWLAFLDDDDVWAPDKLARQLVAARDAGSTWAYGGWVVTDDRLQVIAGSPPPDPHRVAALLPQRNAIPTGGSNVIVRREEFEAAGGFDPQLTNGEDWELWLRLLPGGLPGYVSEPLVAYRIHSEMASLDIDGVLTAVSLIEDRHGTRVDRASIERWIAESCLRTGDRARASRYLMLAAIHGAAIGVARDMLAMVGARIDRRLGRSPSLFRPRPDRAWVERAERWLAPLRLPGEPLGTSRDASEK
jgi:glycosyltransferase involved in cell wall biosynthesis